MASIISRRSASVVSSRGRLLTVTSALLGLSHKGTIIKKARLCAGLLLAAPAPGMVAAGNIERDTARRPYPLCDCQCTTDLGGGQAGVFGGELENFIKIINRLKNYFHAKIIFHLRFNVFYPDVQAGIFIARLIAFDQVSKICGGGLPGIYCPNLLSLNFVLDIRPITNKFIRCC